MMAMDYDGNYVAMDYDGNGIMMAIMQWVSERFGASVQGQPIASVQGQPMKSKSNPRTCTSRCIIIYKYLNI